MFVPVSSILRHTVKQGISLSVVYRVVYMVILYLIKKKTGKKLNRSKVAHVSAHLESEKNPLLTHIVLKLLKEHLQLYAHIFLCANYKKKYT